MAEAGKPSTSQPRKVAVLLVTDGGDPPAVQAGSNYKPHRARYTKSMLRSTLQLMGCKPRTAHKVCCAFLLLALLTCSFAVLYCMNSILFVMQVSERTYRVLDEELSAAGSAVLPQSMLPLHERLQAYEGHN